MAVRRLATLLAPDDLPALSRAIAESFPDAAFFDDEARPIGELAPKGLTRIALADLLVWFTPSTRRPVDYVELGKSALIEGGFGAVSDDSKFGPAASSQMRKLWSVVRKQTSTCLWSTNPTIGEPIKPMKRVRVGRAAIRYWNDGGLLGSVNAHLFYMPVLDEGGRKNP